MFSAVNSTSLLHEMADFNVRFLHGVSLLIKFIAVTACYDRKVNAREVSAAFNVRDICNIDV